MGRVISCGPERGVEDGDSYLNLSNASALARSQCRKGLSAVLRAVPAETFAPLRRTFPASAPASFRHRAQRLALGVVRHRGVPAETESFALVDNPDVWMVNADSYVIERLYWFGESYGYEPEVVPWWREYCRRSSSILELGANIGYFTVQGAKTAPRARYVAVEPHPGCAEVCRRNLEVNGITNVEVVEAAAVAGIEGGSVCLVTPGSTSRDHYQAPCTGYVGRNEMHRDDPDHGSWGSLTVAAVPLAELLAGVDLLKMDVEGQEHALLSSVAEELAVARPTMFVELLDDTPKLRAFIGELCALSGYRCFVPRADRLVPLAAADVPTVSLIRSFGTRDLILTCEEPPGGGSRR